MNHAIPVTQRHSGAFPAAAAPGRPGAVSADGGVCDTARVDLGNWHSLRYWSESLGVSETQLVRATRAVGLAVAQIEKYFAEKRAGRRRRRAARAG
ncbi:MAG TPA: DUF3606 domain-containing protein [Dokdonella sp.]